MNNYQNRLDYLFKQITNIRTERITFHNKTKENKILINLFILKFSLANKSANFQLPENLFIILQSRSHIRGSSHYFQILNFSVKCEVKKIVTNANNQN